MNIDYRFFTSLKGEFEAEGLTQIDVAAEALIAARQGLDYLVKISGAEAKSDVFYLADIGITSLVCPMVETSFAMEKYMDMLPKGVFNHVGVTIETITAVENIDAILNEGKLLTDVTIGRTDLTASFKGESVESVRTMNMVKIVARTSKAKGLRVTIGGSVSKRTLDLLQEDPELCEMIDYVETRKAVMSIDRFLDDAALSHAVKLEEMLLRRRVGISERILPSVNARLKTLTNRA
jgi:hypothetical protein